MCTRFIRGIAADEGVGFVAPLAELHAGLKTVSLPLAATVHAPRHSGRFPCVA